MSALTRDRATSYREGIEVEFPVAAATKIYAGSMVCVNAGGYAGPRRIPAATASPGWPWSRWITRPARMAS